MSTILNKPYMQVDGLSLYFHDEVAVIVMDRGENRLNGTFLHAFNVLIDEVERNELCKGLITTGKGKFYSNGLDLDLIATLPTNETMAFYAEVTRFLKRLMFLPIPTLAAMNGHAFAAGALISLVHDLRTMNSERGWFCLNEVFINRVFGSFNLAMLEAKLGKGKNLNEAAVLGKRYTGNDAHGCGIAHAIQPPNLLLQDSVKVLKSYYGKGYPRESLETMKKDIYHETLTCYNNMVESQRVSNKEMSSKL